MEEFLTVCADAARLQRGTADDFLTVWADAARLQRRREENSNSLRNQRLMFGREYLRLHATFFSQSSAQSHGFKQQHQQLRQLD